MPNIQDHAVSVGSLSLQERAFDELDGLVLSQLVYLPMEGYLDSGGKCTVEEAWVFLKENVDPEPFDRFQKKRWKLFEACAGLERYRRWEMCSYVQQTDPVREMQFCACTYQLPGGVSCVAYRGTDLTVVGWKEDFNMCYMTVPAQQEAVRYLRQAVAKSTDTFILCGHSKGGNLAVYAAASAEADVQQRIRQIYAYDAPGVDEHTFTADGYAAVSSRIRSFVPQSSVVGMLLHHHPVYTVVDAQTIGILQHDVMTWQAADGAFVTLENVDMTGRISGEAVQAWLSGMDVAQRKLLVDTLYHVVGAADAELVTDLATDWLESISKMMAAIRGLDAQVRRDVVKMLHSLFATGASEVVRQVIAALLKLRGEKK